MAICDSADSQSGIARPGIRHMCSWTDATTEEVQEMREELIAMDLIAPYDFEGDVVFPDGCCAQHPPARPGGR